MKLHTRINNYLLRKRALKMDEQQQPSPEQTQDETELNPSDLRSTDELPSNHSEPYQGPRIDESGDSSLPYIDVVECSLDPAAQATMKRFTPQDATRISAEGEKYSSLPYIVRVEKQDEPFEVISKHGGVTPGNAGDYLVYGVKNDVLMVLTASQLSAKYERSEREEFDGSMIDDDAHKRIADSLQDDEEDDESDVQNHVHIWKKGVSPVDGLIKTCTICMAHEKVDSSEWANLPA